MKTYNILIIEIKEPISDIITAKQGDTNSRFLDVYLRDNGRPVDLTGNEVKIYGRKKDGKAFFNNGEITDAVNGRCQFELTNQALAVAGDLALEISIWQDNKRTLTTQTFHVFVAPRIRNDKVIESSNEFNTLVVIFEKLDDFIKEASELIDRIGLPPDTGGTSTAGTVMAKLNKLLTDWTTARAEKIDTIHTNVSNLNTRLTSTRAGYLDKLANFGATGDTGGSASAGTMMAKLNKLLTDWTTTRAGYIDTIRTYTSNLNTRLTSTRAGYLDKLANFGATGDTGGSATAGTMMAKLNAILTANNTNAGNIDSAIGTTKDTGGTTTAGTVMAKLNKLLTDWTSTKSSYLTYLNSRLTATRAGYLDKLANFGAVNDTGGTSTAGTMMAKLNKLLTDWTTTRATYITNVTYSHRLC